MYCPVTDMPFFSMTHSVLNTSTISTTSKSYSVPFTLASFLKSINLCGIQLMTSMYCENGSFIPILCFLSFHFLFVSVKTSLLSQSNFVSLVRDTVKSLLEFHEVYINGFSLLCTLVIEFNNSKLGAWHLKGRVFPWYAIHTHASADHVLGNTAHRFTEYRCWIYWFLLSVNFSLSSSTNWCHICHTVVC